MLEVETVEHCPSCATSARDDTRLSPVATLSALWLLLPLCFGLALRLWNISAQVLGDDEAHMVRLALVAKVSDILTTYQLADASLPLTALFRFLMDRGCHLTEIDFRLPSLITGALLLVAAPLLAVRRWGARVGIALAWLLALSPNLVFYSRIARSYMPVVLLAGAAAVAFESWWRHPRWWSAATYVLCAALATWLHPVAASFAVASPFAFAAAALVARREERRRLAPLAGLAIATALSLLAFMLPARQSLLRLISDKHQHETPSSRAVWATLELLAGNGHWPVAALFWAAALGGLALLWQEHPRSAVFTAVLALGHVGALLLLSPEFYALPLILCRYLLVALPVALLWLAFALARVTSWTALPWALRWGAPALFLALLLGTGPLVDPSLRRTSFAHRDGYLEFCSPRDRLAAGDVPEFYRGLTLVAGPGAVLEYPWNTIWRLNRAYSLYQETHLREVVVGSPYPLSWDERLDFRNMVPGLPEGFLASRARYLVIHRDLAREEARVRDSSWRPVGELLTLARGTLQAQARMTGRRLKRLWGDPDYADEWIQVWDLDRIRASPVARLNDESADCGRAASRRGPRPG